MSKISLNNDQPVFVIGVGRCGSTYVQKMICENSPVWIWGEHEGLLNGLFQSCKRARESKTLNNYSYLHSNISASEKLAKGNNITAWMLPFLPEDLNAIERELVVDLFGRCLPAGYHRWGFKEIRYGPKAGVPDRLVKIFPNCRIIHLVRDPFAGIDSALRAWHTGLVTEKEKSNDPLITDKLEEVYSTHLKRWFDTTQYLLDLEKQHPEQVQTFKIEDIEKDCFRMFDFIGAPLGGNANMKSIDSRPINQSPLSKATLSRYSSWFIEISKQNADYLAVLTHRLGYSLSESRVCQK
jgi:hypothetical protein